MAWLVQLLRRGVLTGGAFFLFFGIGTILAYVVLPVIRLSVPSRAEASRRCRLLVARVWVAFHGYMRFCGLLHYDPCATRIVLPASGAVVVANHPTLVDVTAVISACPELVFVAKKEIFRSPLIGRVLRQCDQIESGPGVFAGAAVIDEAVARLRNGSSVFMFPEGTRSPENAIGPFLPGAFEIAVRAGAPIVPLFITCDPPALMRGQPWYDIPGRTVHLTVTQLDTLAPPLDRPARAREALFAIYARKASELARRDSTETAELNLSEGTWNSWKTN